MLLEFTVRNFRSFRDENTFSLMATGRALTDGPEPGVHRLPDGRRVLTVSVLVGPNASGKSSLVLAMRAFQILVSGSAERAGVTELFAEPFRLGGGRSAEEPISFEIVWATDGRQHRYGFEFDRQGIRREWLFERRGGREARLFERAGQNVELGRRFSEGRGLAGRCREDALFLSVCAQWNGELAQVLVAQFTGALLCLTTETGDPEQRNRLLGLNATTLLDRPSSVLARGMGDLLRNADLGITGVRAERVVVPGATSGARRSDSPYAGPPGDPPWVFTTHRSEDGRDVAFPLARESDGSQRMFELAGPFLDGLARGWCLVIDELDSRLHPALVRQIVRAFQDPARNPAGAQLVVVGHAYDLLDESLLRRDQIWFAEKSEAGASTLFSLAEVKGLRKGRDWLKSYMAGQLGAVPMLRRELL